MSREVVIDGVRYIPEVTLQERLVQIPTAKNHTDCLQVEVVGFGVVDGTLNQQEEGRKLIRLVVDHVTADFYDGMVDELRRYRLNRGRN